MRDLEQKYIWLGTGAIVLVLGAILTGTFSGIVTPDPDCQWTTLEADTGQTFNNLEELENYLGSSEFDQRMNMIEESESLDIRDPAVGDVEWQRCVISQ